MTRKRASMHEVACFSCGKVFDALRDDARYCGPKCRKVVSRDRLKYYGTPCYDSERWRTRKRG